MFKKTVAVLGTLMAASAVAVVPSGAAHAAAPVCTFDISYNNNSLAARCSSGPGTYYAAVIKCTNSSSNRFGPERRYGSGIYSAVGCSGDGKIQNYGVGTR